MEKNTPYLQNHPSWRYGVEGKINSNAIRKNTAIPIEFLVALHTTKTFDVPSLALHHQLLGNIHCLSAASAPGVVEGNGNNDCALLRINILLATSSEFRFWGIFSVFGVCHPLSVSGATF